MARLWSLRESAPGSVARVGVSPVTNGYVAIWLVLKNAVIADDRCHQISRRGLVENPVPLDTVPHCARFCQSSVRQSALTFRRPAVALPRWLVVRKLVRG